MSLLTHQDTTYLNTIFKEEGISKIILDYKTELEFVETIQKTPITSKKNINTIEYIYFGNHNEPGDIIPKQKLLTQNIMEQYADYLNWENIQLFQPLTKDFINKHFNKIDWTILSKNKNLTNEVLTHFSEYIIWEYRK